MTWDGRSTVEMITSIGHQRRDVVVVGAGQAGLAVSWNLRLLGIDHAVLERDRVGESWRSARWDSFTLVTPAWMTRLPGLTQPPGTGAEFTTRDDLVAMLVAYSKQRPVRTGVEVTALQRAGRRYQLTTSEGVLTARAVVAATGALRRPVIPAMAARLPGTLLQLHAGQYRNPAALPPGAALVVGSGQSGAQIAEELAHAGRQVFLATSQVGRTPRRYRGRDAHDWAQELGLHDRSADQARPEERRAANPLLAGAHGGHTLALQQLARDGVVLLGRLVDVTGTTLRFSDSAAANLHYGDQAAAAFRRAVDEHIRRHHLPAPPADLDPAERPYPLVPSPSKLDITADAITTVIWCVGFSPDTAWIDLPVLDRTGAITSRGGVTAIPGLYTLGAPWLTHRGSGILYGVATDASSIARHLAAYLGHASPVQRQIAAAGSLPQRAAS